MPRVIAGRFKGLRLVSPAGLTTRPTADRVKEALFSMLASLPFDLDGVRVLDFFSGSGALALEALSRGAGSAVLADRDRGALAAIRRNLDAAKPDPPLDTLVLAAVWPQAFGRLPAGRPFDLFFLDPPYASKNPPLELLRLASALGLAAPRAVAVWEQAPETLNHASGLAEAGAWRLVKTRVWGRRAAAFLRHEP